MPNPLVAEKTARTVTGLVVPYGVPGDTSAGPVIITAGVLQIPEELKRVKLFRDHSNAGGQPVGFATKAESTEEGLFMTFSIARTSDGDNALADVAEGTRDALSVEIFGSAIDTAGNLTAGELTGVALVPVPAYRDARVTAFTAALVDNPTPTPDRKEETPMTTETPKAETPAAKAPATLVASRSDKAPITLERVTHALAAHLTGQTPEDTLTAALADITKGGNPAVAAPGWLGELWGGVSYKREIVPTFTQKNLKSMKVSGWRWKVKPTVSDYAGDKAEVPTNSPTTEAIESTAKRLAGAHDIDRAFFDFGDVEFLNAYFSAMSESYAMLSDEKAAAYAVAEAAKNKGAKQTTLLRAAAKAKQLIKSATKMGSNITYLVHPDDQFDLLDITDQTASKYLELVGVTPDHFISSEKAKKGAVVAYAKPALEFYELAGAPIRVQAEHLSHAGKDAALFGYYATLTTHPKGVVQVEFGPTQ